MTRTLGGVFSEISASSNTITLGSDLTSTSPGVLAAHLAHEGTHVQWNQAGSVEQEYHAFEAQAQVWNLLRGSEADSQCDWVSEIIGSGEIEAKTEIRLRYWWLPK